MRCQEESWALKTEREVKVSESLPAAGLTVEGALLQSSLLRVIPAAGN